MSHCPLKLQKMVAFISLMVPVILCHLHTGLYQNTINLAALRRHSVFQTYQHPQ